MSTAVDSVADAACLGFKVAVRCRPLNCRERDTNQKVIVDVDERHAQVSLRNPDTEEAEPKRFTFDKVFGPETSQQEFFSSCTAPLVSGVLAGVNGSVFSYGQTGAGKTWAVQGMPDDPEHKGFLSRATEQIFQHIKSDTSRSYCVQLSYLELYNEAIHDLLSDSKQQSLMLKQGVERGVYVEGLSHHVVTDKRQCHNLVVAGTQRKSVRQTMMSAISSRSHTILCLEVTSVGRDGASAEAESTRRAKLFLVDLAGSERVKTSGVSGLGLREASSINRSLSALGSCICALTDNKSRHVPYRDSKLTRLLQESLGGNANTMMCCHVSPAEANLDETLSTMRYGNRASKITNKPRVNTVTTGTPNSPPPPADQVAGLTVPLHANNGQLEAAPRTAAAQSADASGSGAKSNVQAVPPSLAPGETLNAVQTSVTGTGPGGVQVQVGSARARPVPPGKSAKSSPEGEEGGEEEWVVVVPTATATKSVEEMVAALHAEGVASLAPAAFLERFRAFVTAKDGIDHDEWEQI